MTAEQEPRSQGHPDYKSLNRLLAEASFDRWIEERCLAYYQEVDRRGQLRVTIGAESEVADGQHAVPFV